MLGVSSDVSELGPFFDGRRIGISGTESQGRGSVPLLNGF